MAVTVNGDPLEVAGVHAQVATPAEIATVPHPVIVVLPYLKAIDPVALATTVARRLIVPPAVVAVLSAETVVDAPPLTPTTIERSADCVIPTVSVVFTRIAYEAAARFEATETTPEELMVIPLTVELSEAFTTDHVQDELEPVPPEIDGVDVFAVPKVVETLGNEREIDG